MPAAMENFPTALDVVAAALIDAKGRVLIQQRRADKQHGGLWEFPGGKVEAGESQKTGLVRELAEELGIVVDPVDLAFCADAGGDDQGIVISLYTCTRWQGTARNFDAAALRWVVPAAVSELLMPPLDVPLAQALVRLLRADI